MYLETTKRCLEKKNKLGAPRGRKMLSSTSHLWAHLRLQMPFQLRLSEFQLGKKPNETWLKIQVHASVFLCLHKFELETTPLSHCTVLACHQHWSPVAPSWSVCEEILLSLPGMYILILYCLGKHSQSSIKAFRQELALVAGC